MQKSMKATLKQFSIKHKNNKVLYYTISFVRQLFPKAFPQSELDKKIATIKDFDIEYIRKRVNYYNKLEENVSLSDVVKSLINFKLRKRHKTYFFDSYEYTRYFHSGLKVDFKFGDVTFVPEEPAVVKSRPIFGNNSNSVVLNLDKVRHFTFINDKKDFRTKKNMLVGRNVVGQAHRIKFLEMYINHPLCDIGKINNDDNHQNLLKGRLTIEEQLDYKFILCLEGNDVASNLKWVMSSQSLAVMPAPKYETWYMEGTLIANHHYVQIKEDYSDLEERMEFYINHTDEALKIIKNAHQYVEQFKIKPREDLISLLVLEKYFYKTNQKTVSENLKILFSTNNEIKIN
ncbi:MAG TPA: glycosyl transferase family 90 [Clostridia bacterium]|nr:glycosyl transferase family 90 [Clostridia bacterium]